MQAQSDPSRKQSLLGLVVRRPPGKLKTEAFYEEFSVGMDDVASQHGYAVVRRIVPSIDVELDCYRQWKDFGEVAGVVLVDLEENDPRPGLLGELGLPFAIMGEVNGGGTTVQPVDNYGAMEDAVRNLARFGHRRLGRVSGPSRLLHTQARGLSFERMVESAELTGNTVEGDYTAESGYVATLQLLDLALRPTAIIYENDEMASGGMAAARARNLSIPQDLSLLAWDDSPLCQLADPPLSAMHHDIPALGEHAAHALVTTIAGRRAPAYRTSAPTFIERGTTAPPSL